MNTFSFWNFRQATIVYDRRKEEYFQNSEKFSVYSVIYNINVSGQDFF